jgi:hypothetical protein
MYERTEYGQYAPLRAVFISRLFRWLFIGEISWGWSDSLIVYDTFMPRVSNEMSEYYGELLKMQDSKYGAIILNKIRVSRI